MRRRDGHVATIYRRVVLLASLGSAIVGCVGWGDVFTPRRTLPGGYELVRTEGPYLVVKAGHSRVTQGDPLLGEVTSLGWSDRYLVAKRLGGSSRGRSGWIIVDVQTGGMNGPLSDAEFRDMRDRDVALLQVKILRLEDAWKELSRR